jgi:flagellar hook-associated protein 1 FlgK
MSISSALSNALSGLTVSSRAADVVSSNVANAMTDGYGVREVNIAARLVGNAGAGARIAGITRHEDTVLIGHRRLSDAAHGAASTQSAFWVRLETMIGTPDQPGSLAGRTAQFQSSLIAASNAPHSHAHLSAAVASASDLATQINTISDGIQAERLQADGDIARHVGRINEVLQTLADLNTRIRRGSGDGRDVSSLLDAQAKLLDEISPLVPLQTRRDSTMALQIYSRDGQALLDGRPSVLGFAPVSVMEADMARDAGSLSGLTLNGRELPLGAPGPALGGGELLALFSLRDGDAVTAQAAIDGVARDLAARFDQSGLDPTLAAGAPGLFTDASVLVTAGNEVGLAGRLRVNAAVRPSEGGAVWRLRDGLGATSEGAIGQSAFLNAQVDLLSDRRATVSGGFSGVSRDFAGLVSDHLTETGLTRQRAETTEVQTALQLGALREAELAQGVDTDEQMQTLLRIEKAYAANARVMQAVGEMIDELMRVGR